MNLKKSQPNQFTIFAFIWSAATIFHQFFYGVIFSTPLDFILTLLAIITLLRPATYQFLITQVCLQSFTIFLYLPNVYNHWFLAFFVSSSIVLNYLKIIISQKSFRSCATELYKNFAPVLRIILIIVYFSAFFHKLNKDYFSIDTSCGVFMYSKILKIYSFLPSGELAIYIVIYLSLILEIAIPLLLLFRKTRMLGILIGLYTHLIFGFMGYLNFSLIMFALLALYLPAGFFSSWNNSSLNKLNYFKVIIYILSVLLTAIFIFGRFNYILNDTKVLINIGKMAHAILSMVIIFIFIHFLNIRKYEWPKNFYKINYLNIIIIMIVILNSFSPYLGFKTRNVFSMYSNLSTENYNSNHLLVKNGFLLGRFQNDLVTIGKTNLKKIQKYHIMPYAQLQNYLYNAYRKGKRDIKVEYIRNNKKVYLKLDDDSVVLKNSVLNFLQWKFFTFKPVSLDEKKHCGL